MQDRKASKDREISISSRKGDDGNYMVPNMQYISMITRKAYNGQVIISATGNSIKRMYDLLHGKRLDGRIVVVGHKSYRLKIGDSFTTKVELTIQKSLENKIMKEAGPEPKKGITIMSVKEVTEEEVKQCIRT